jgi:hypothetical protein
MVNMLDHTNLTLAVAMSYIRYAVHSVYTIHSMYKCIVPYALLAFYSLSLTENERPAR